MPHKSGVKRGAYGTMEKQFMAANADKMSAADIAKHLNRSVETVRAYINKHLHVEVPTPQPESPKAKVRVEEKATIGQDLRDSLNWKKLKDEFNDDEIAYFEEEYIALISQFGADVVKTEEQQIRKAITMDILMRRNLSERKKLRQDIERLASFQEGKARKYKAEKDGLSESERQGREEQLLNLETQLASLRAAEQSKTKEYSDLDTRHQKLMEALKATREQRITRVEKRGSFLDILKLLQDEQERGIEGRQMDLMRKAGVKEMERLGKPHKYDDGLEDLPILSAETLTALEQPKADEEE